MTDQPLPLLMLPGLLCDERLFAAQVVYFHRERQVITGRVDSGHTIDAIAQAVLQDAPEEFVLAGFSLGGIVAQEIVRQAPQRVARLILMGTTAECEPDAYRPIRQRFIAMAKEQGTAAVVQLIGKSFFPRYVAQSHLQDARLKSVVLAMAEHGGAATFIQQSQALLERPDRQQDLALITCPTLLLCGAEDVLCTPTIHRDMSERIGAATLAIIPDCGHMSTLEQPDAMNQAISEWLARV